MGIKNNYDHICIITSALGSPLGVVPLQTRFEQTIHSIETVRNKIPNCCIILSDVSVHPCSAEKEVLRGLVDVFLDYSQSPDLINFSNSGLKSHGDLLTVRMTMDFITQYIDLTNINRIFKLSGRHNITEEFDIRDYDNTEGKYVFKKPVKSWISPDLLLYEARLFSLHKTNLDDYISKWQNMINSCDGRFDLEHTYYKWLDQNDVIEVDNIWVEGYVAADGHYQKD